MPIEGYDEMSINHDLFQTNLAFNFVVVVDFTGTD